MVAPPERLADYHGVRIWVDFEPACSCYPLQLIMSLVYGCVKENERASQDKDVGKVICKDIALLRK